MNMNKLKIGVRFFATLLLTFFLWIPFGLAETASLANVRGEVEVLRANTANWIPAEDGMELQKGDEVKTGIKGSVRVVMDASEVTLEQKTNFRFKSYEIQNGQSSTSLELMLGRLKANVQKLKTGSNRIIFLLDF